MVSVTASVDGAASRAFDAAFSEFAKSLGDGIATAPRRAAISMCKNFQAATRQARKNKSMTANVSADSPQWITYKDGKKLANPLRRLKVTLNDRGKTFTRFVYAGSRQDMKRQLRELAGTNYFPTGAATKGGREKTPQKKGGTRGLAQRSWGWVMHNIYSARNPDTPWQRRKNDKRNPKDTARESYSKEMPSAISPSGIARISNRLDYIGDALRISVDAILQKAANKLIRPIINAQLRAGGMSAEEIRKAGHEAHQEWLKQFDS